MDLIGWAIFIVALLVSVMLHETGHFVVVKRFGMKVTRYFVGFGPSSGPPGAARPSTGSRRCPSGVSSRSSACTRWTIPTTPRTRPRAFRNNPAGQRILVLCAGGRCTSSPPCCWSSGWPSGSASPTTTSPSWYDQPLRAHQSQRLRQRHLRLAACAGAGQAGRAAGRRCGDRLRRPSGEQLHPARRRDRRRPPARRSPSPSAATGGWSPCAPSWPASAAAASPTWASGPGCCSRWPARWERSSTRARPSARCWPVGPGRHGGAPGAPQAVRQEPVEPAGQPGHRLSARPRPPAPRRPPTTAGSTRSASCCCSSPR